MRASCCGHRRKPVGGPKAQKPWLLDEGGMESSTVRHETEARAHMKVMGSVEKIADVP
jgi:hypothetical protein